MQELVVCGLQFVLCVSDCAESLGKRLCSLSCASWASFRASKARLCRNINLGYAFSITRQKKRRLDFQIPVVPSSLKNPLMTTWSTMSAACFVLTVQAIYGLGFRGLGL